MTRDALRKLLADATPGPWQVEYQTGVAEDVDGNEVESAWMSGPRMLDMGDYQTLRESDAALIVAAVNALPTLLAMAEAARDLYSLAVGEHGHDETHSADWPSCLPAHIAMNRYRDALGRLDALP